MGDVHLRHPLAYSSAGDMPAVDVTLVCLKTTVDVVLPPSAGVVVLLQNGLGNEERLACRRPRPAGHAAARRPRVPLFEQGRPRPSTVRRR